MRDRADVDRLRADRGALVRALESAGAEIRGTAVKCPFHEDRTASGSIHEHDNTWSYTCHACCWSGDHKSGDVFAVVQRSAGVDFAGACERLGLYDDTGGHRPGNGSHVRESKPDTSADDVERLASEANRRLLGDPATLDHLWRTRAVDRAIVERFRVGITGEPGRRFWTFPVGYNGHVEAVKAHRADGQDGGKSWWQPKGVDRSRLWPVFLDGDGPVWLCPGELKTLAVIGVGLPAVGITSGEGCEKRPTDLPSDALPMLRGREVAVAPDDDPTGAAWGEHVRGQLADAGINARVVDLDLDKCAGVKDIGDWITRRAIEDAKDPEAIRATLLDRWRRSDPWFGCLVGDSWSSGKMWKPVTYVPTGLRQLDHALGGGLRTRGVHLLVGKPGQAKTQVATRIAVGAAVAGVPTGLLSLELGADEVAQLVAAALGDIPRRSLAMGQVSGDYAERLRRVQRDFGSMPLAILDDDKWAGGLDREGLASLVADGCKRFGWRMVVCDYLGLLAPMERDRSDFQTDLLNSSMMRAIARRNDLALVVVAALRKSGTFAKKEKEAKITLDDVAGAGRLVYDAQNVLLVTTERGGDDSASLVCIRPLKMRFSPMHDGDVVGLRWRPSTGAIEDLNP